MVSPRIASYPRRPWRNPRNRMHKDSWSKSSRPGAVDRFHGTPQPSLTTRSARSRRSSRMKAASQLLYGWGPSSRQAIGSDQQRVGRPRVPRRLRAAFVTRSDMPVAILEAQGALFGWLSERRPSAVGDTRRDADFYGGYPHIEAKDAFRRFRGWCRSGGAAGCRSCVRGRARW